MVQLLLHAGADPNKAVNFGRISLHAAVKKYRVDVVKVLLDGGAEIDREDMDVAAVNGYKYVVKVLLERGADPSKQDMNGRDSLALAAMMGHIDVAIFLLEQREVYQTKKDKQGRDALALATINGHKDMVKLLQEVENCCGRYLWEPPRSSCMMGFNNTNA